MSSAGPGPLRRLREAAGLSQQEVARRAGMSVRALRYLENGGVTRPQAASVSRLAEALGVPAEELARRFAAAPAARDTRPPGLRVQALGPLAVRRGGDEVPLGSAMRRLLLGLLAVQPGRPVGIEEIIDTLWPADPPPTCRQLVHTYISALRRLLADAGAIRVGADGYRLELGEDGVDVVEFERLSAQGHAAVHARALDSAAQLFAEAWALWRGPLPAGEPRLAQHPAVVRLVRQRAESVLAWADAAFVLARYGEVVKALRSLLDQDPLHERLAAHLVLALAGQGQQAEALAVFERTRDVLDQELGIRPGAELRTAHLRVLRGQLPPTERRVISTFTPPAQLPSDSTAFLGRTRHLATLDALVGPDGVTERVVLLTGMPGAGKTALAVHWGHRMRAQFPDGQLYVDLRGHSREQPVLAVHALAGFLHGLGVAPDQVPGDRQQAAAAYRSRLAGKRVLIVLDNAASAEQVRPLLPSGPGSLAVVTSRHRLGGLVAREAARVLALSPLTADESRRLLTRLLGAERALAEPDAVAETAELCAQLPLALRIAAANLTTRPELRIARFNERLRAGNRLDLLEVADDADTAVRAAFQLSCDELPSAQRRMFRLLALTPGPDIGMDAAAALAGIDPGETERSLRHLADRHLVVERSLDRYTQHDLLRLHARELSWPDAAEDEPVAHDADCGCANAGAHAAFLRLARHQHERLTAVADLLYPYLLHLPEDPSDPRSATVDWDADAARAWLEEERAGLMALIRHLCALGHHRDAWRLTDLLAGHFMLRGVAAEWTEVCEAAYAAARVGGDGHAQAAMQMHTATAFHFGGQTRRAAERFRAAADSAHRVGWTQGEAVALNNLAICLFNAGEPEQAIAAFERALALHRKAGRTAGEAVTLSNLGAAHIDQGRDLAQGERGRAAQRKAIAYLEDGLLLHRAIEDRRNEGETLRALAEAHRDIGDLDVARAQATEALRLARAAGDRRFEASALCLLGTVHARLGQVSDALAYRAQGLEAVAELAEPRLEADGHLSAADTSLVLGLTQDALLHLDNARFLARQIGSGQLERRCDLLTRRIEMAGEAAS
ncbi:helix-turn-helix domain-containing protein [Actinospica durhamensis]|uniref:Helix-turn-helix domain-containing protein n=1 Tax=Actinospica durhamensis TaxID=1508375 RepID=A0A941IN12_9ACTN|nr:BTAD domain-containing putative transcriptional regulator [Actinospica durhamensis]MBR7834855.1 helix-turn-helix domain-containing protein [Actinospica durhamensis]